MFAYSISAVSSDWLIAEGLDKKVFRESLVTVAVSFIELLGSILKVSFLGNQTDGNALLRLSSEDSLKQIALLLVQCLSVPVFEVAVAGISTVGVLGQRDSSSPILSLHSKSVNFFLTNALLRRLTEPNAFAVTSHYLTYLDPTDSSSSKRSSSGKKGKTVKTTDKQQQASTVELKELTQKRNIELSSLRITDACFNALIDLHSSDDPLYLDSFVRLNCLDKLASSFQDFGLRWTIIDGKTDLVVSEGYFFNLSG